MVNSILEYWVVYGVHYVTYRVKWLPTIFNSHTPTQLL